MKLIYCNECHDVVRLIKDKWRTCECRKSGGQYNTDLITATVGGNCKVFGIANPFFDDVVPYLTEQGKQWWRNKTGYGLPNTSDCWYGEFPGDYQIFRILSSQGPRLKTKNQKLTYSLQKVTILDKRMYSIAGQELKSVVVEISKPSFISKKK